MNRRARAIEERFRAQYRDLDEDTLRRIASGKAPWGQGGEYVWAARRAARAELCARGVGDVPSVPWLDPNAPGLGWGGRTVAVVLAFGVVAVVAGLWRLCSPILPDACAEGAALLAREPLLVQSAPRIVSCRSDSGVAVARFCATVTPGDRLRLGRPEGRYTCSWLRRLGVMATCPPPPDADGAERCSAVPVAFAWYDTRTGFVRLGPPP